VSDTTPFIGSKISLVSALQTRGNSRILFCGSEAMFADAHENGKVTNEFLDWVFQMKSKLRVRDAVHHRQGEVRQHGIYRIKDDMVYSLGIDEFKGGEWVGFNGGDVQFSTQMLDDYVRLDMTGNDGFYFVNFTLPDVYGVFTFKVTYWRYGLTFLDSSDIVQVW
jgi:oligosaccharyltransferase complex subunit beta